MATASINTVLDHTSDAAFRTWVAELITLWVTTLGLTQTADTGQINTATVTRPGTSTKGGYVILRFNDTLQATSPLFIRIDFGTGSGASTPNIWVQIGTGSNGSGTLTGLTSSSLATTTSGAPLSTVTAYITRACYNTTQGVFWCGWKYAAQNSSGGTSQGGFYITRSNDATGAPTGDAVMMCTNSTSTTTGTTSGGPYMSVISKLANAAYTTSAFPSNAYFFDAFGLPSTVFGANGVVLPVYQYTPNIGFQVNKCMAKYTDIGLHATVSLTLVGSTAHTYIQAGPGFGLGGGGVQALTYAVGGSSGAMGFLMLWE